MIVKPFIIVSGKYNVDDDVIFTRLLKFVNLPKLPGMIVIEPKKNAAPGAQRVLKIVADTIDTGSGGNAEITYNLDGDMTLPSVMTGLDPETKAMDGDKGQPDYGEPLLGVDPLDTAKPNYLEINLADYVGAYPKAESGGDGQPGGKGGKGARGTDGPIVEIWTNQIKGDGLIIDIRGQEGGDGGPGGRGQHGGNGQMGSPGVPGADETWIGVPTMICKQRPGLGGDGGRGGDAGCGGDGGDGGNGGFFKLFYTAGVDISKIKVQVEGGKGGQVGNAGEPGTGGKAGPPGINIVECLSALGSPDGPNGRSCNCEKDGEVTRLGVDGADGSTAYYKITDLPQIPEF